MVSFTIKEDMLHCFCGFTAGTEAFVIEVGHLGPVGSNLVSIVEEFPQEVSYVCGDVSPVHEGGFPCLIIPWFFVFKVVNSGLCKVEICDCMSMFFQPV